MTSWLTIWIPPVDLPSSPSPVGVFIHFMGGTTNPGNGKDCLLFQGLVVWLSWLSAWLASKKPWVSSVPHILSMAVYTCNYSTWEAEGRGC